MEVRLTTTQMAQIIQHSEGAYPNEGCGILIGRAENGHKIVVEIIPAGNAREENAQHNRYLIPPEELLQGELRAEELGLDVIGYFHSHPDHPARPSEYDREHGWPFYSYLITSVENGRAIVTRAWSLREDRSAFDEETLVTTSEGE